MKISYDTRTTRFRFVADDGEVVTTRYAADALHELGCFVAKQPEAVVPTAAGWAVIEARAQAEAEARAIPPGWEATLDGAEVTLVGSAATFTKTFRRVADGATCAAPVVDEAGTTSPDTAACLAAYDADHPFVQTATPPEA